jgi:1-acyl-sn-glycerol-3-phosphate acyltransferase
LLKALRPKRLDYLFKVRRFGRILVYTISMFLVTHLIVFFYLFPIGTVRIIINPNNASHIKKSTTGLLFSIIGKRLKVLGMGNIDPEKNYLIVSNYPGSYAGFALMNVFPDASILVHSFLSRVPIVGFLLKSTGATFVQQKGFGRTKQAIDRSLKHIENRSIIILPEGGRSPDGSIRAFKRGFIYIVRHSSLDLLPITLRGFYNLKPLKRPYLDPDSELEIVIHKPIGHSIAESLGSEGLLKHTIETIKGAYKP